MELDTVCVWAHFSRHWWRSRLTLLPTNNEKNNYQLTWMRFSFLSRSWFFLFSKMCSALSWAGAMSLPIMVVDRAPIPGLVICISIWRNSYGTETKKLQTLPTFWLYKCFSLLFHYCFRPFLLAVKLFKSTLAVPKTKVRFFRCS